MAEKVQVGARLRSLMVVAAVAVIALTAVCLAPASAHAGTWTLVSCTLPDGTPAPTAGWSAGVYGSGINATGSGDVNTCPTGGSLIATSSSAGQPGDYSGPEWTFTAPAGMTIAGGQITASLTAPQGQAWIGTPDGAYDSSDVVAGCQLGAPCGAGGTASGLFGIAHPGGTTIYAPALCVIAAQTTCPPGGGAGGVNAQVAIHSAQIELNSDAVPTATGFSGSLLAGHARGTADLRFTAADRAPEGGSGPGVYSVLVTVGGVTVYSGIPNGNGGKCAAVGTDAADGALMFDYAQPCKAFAHVTVPIDTTKLPDGPHTMAVSVTDAAGNTTTVTPKRTFTTSNPITTPAPTRTREVATRFVLGFAWKKASTTLVTAGVRDLARGSRIAVTCSGRKCPRLAPAHVTSSHVSALLAMLRTRTFHAGDRVYLTVAAPPPAVRYQSVHGKRRRIGPAPGSAQIPEHVRLRIRRGARPGVRLVSAIPVPARR